MNENNDPIYPVYHTIKIPYKDVSDSVIELIIDDAKSSGYELMEGIHHSANFILELRFVKYATNHTLEREVMQEHENDI